MTDEAPAPSQPKLTPAIRGELLAWLERGLPIEVAAELAGTNESAVSVWRSKSRQKVPGLVRFDAEVTRAMALGKSVLLAQVRTAGKSNWRAAAWLLERMYPEQFGPPRASDIPDVPPYQGVRAPADDQAGL